MLSGTPTAVPDNAKQVDPQPVLMDKKIMASALLLSGHMPKNTSLVYSEKEGLGWHDSGGWDVYFGKTLDDLEMKISMYQAIIDQLKQKEHQAQLCQFGIFERTVLPRGALRPWMN